MDKCSGTPARLAGCSAMLLAVSYGARFAAGYIARCWSRLRRGRRFAVDVIAPNYGPALVVSTDDFDDVPAGKVREDGYHTKTFRRLAWLETLRRLSVIAALGIAVLAFLIWLRDKFRRNNGKEEN